MRVGCVWLFLLGLFETKGIFVLFLRFLQTCERIQNVLEHKIVLSHSDFVSFNN